MRPCLAPAELMVRSAATKSLADAIVRRGGGAAKARGGKRLRTRGGGGGWAESDACLLGDGALHLDLLSVMQGARSGRQMG